MNENERTEAFVWMVGWCWTLFVFGLTIAVLIYIPITRYILTLIVLIILIGILIEVVDASHLDEEN